MAERVLSWFPISGSWLRLGRVRSVFSYVNVADHHGQALVATYLRTLAAEYVDIDACARAARDLLRWSAQQNWPPAMKDRFKAEVIGGFKKGTYGRAAADTRIKEAIEEIAGMDWDQAAKVWSVLHPHMWGLTAAGSVDAFRAFQRILGALGAHDEGWIKLVHLFDEKAIDKMAEAADVLRDGAKKLETMSPGPDYDTLFSKLQEAKGLQSRIKGLLGEIYLTRWPILKAEIATKLSDAHLVAAKLGPEWEVRHVVGNIRMEGLESYDQAIFLINRVSEQVMLHTAVQMKVEKGRISALKQILKDLQRETVRMYASKLNIRPPAPPTVVIDENLSGYRLIDLPEGEVAHRYVFFAEGGRVSNADVKALDSLGVMANAMPIDLPVAWLDALSIEIMAAAKKMTKPAD